MGVLICTSIYNFKKIIIKTNPYTITINLFFKLNKSILHIMQDSGFFFKFSTRGKGATSRPKSAVFKPCL